MVTKIQYYSPRISITAGELYDVAANWIISKVWDKNGFVNCGGNVANTVFRGNYYYSKGNVAFRFSTLDERSPLVVIGTNKREMQRAASRLSRILKIGPFDMVDKGMFV